MPSVLRDDVLGDALVGVVDDVRREVHEALGTRPYRVAIVTRTWSGARPGQGTPSESILELDPTPRVDETSQGRMAPGGREDDGGVTLTEVSLRYSEADLNPPRLPPNVEVAYMLTEAQGHARRPRFFVLAAAPIVRRGDHAEDNTDWVIRLKRTTKFGQLDNANSP